MKMTMSAYQQKILWFMLGLVVAVKIVFFISYGPIISPDSVGYMNFADEIVHQTDWWYYVDINTLWYPPNAFRSIGYPLVLAMGKLISPEYANALVVLFQSVLSLLTSYLILRLSYCLSERFWVAAFCALAHAISQALLVDQSILTDSLNTSLLLIVICMLGRSILQNDKPTFGKMLGVGLLIALAFLVREAGNQLQYLYWSFALFWIYKSTASMPKKALLFVCFILPMLVFIQAYKGWNEYRTGERFITTAGQTTMFFPALELKVRGINAFENDEYLNDLEPYLEPLDVVPQLQNVAVINRHLTEKHGMNSNAKSQYAFKKFFGYWIDHPLGMVQVTLSRLRSKQLFLDFMPFETMLTIDFWSTSTKPFNKTRDLFEKVRDEFRYDLLVAYLGRNIERLISIIITVGFIIGVPVLLVRKIKQNGGRLSALDQKHVLITLFWLIYVGYTFAFAMVHLEQRYLLPVVPLSVMAGLFVLMHPLERFWAKLCLFRKQ
jgi:hypothetical protein